MLTRFSMMGIRGIKGDGSVFSRRITIFPFVALRCNFVYGTDVMSIRREYCKISLVFRKVGNGSVNNVKSVKMSWKDLKNLVDLPENRNQGLKCRVVGIKDQVVKLGGVRVLVFYFGRYELDL